MESSKSQQALGQVSTLTRTSWRSFRLSGNESFTHIHFLPFLTFSTMVLSQVMDGFISSTQNGLIEDDNFTLLSSSQEGLYLFSQAEEKCRQWKVDWTGNIQGERNQRSNGGNMGYLLLQAFIIRVANWKDISHNLKILKRFGTSVNVLDQ